MEDVPLKMQIIALFDLCLDVLNALAVAAQQGSGRREPRLGSGYAAIDPAVTNSVRLIRRLLIATAYARRPAFGPRLSN